MINTRPSSPHPPLHLVTPNSTLSTTHITTTHIFANNNYKSFNMSKSRTPLILGGAAVSGIGYYLYAAGGNPRAAEKKAESDAHSVAADIKSHLPGRSPNAEGELKGAGAAAGAKIDSVAAEADRQAGVIKSNVESVAKDAKAEAMRVVDKFDHRVEAEAAKAKGGISSWFGGGK